VYLTLAQLADAKLTRELAQVATPDDARVLDDALMEATLRDQDRSAWPADQVALADAAAVTITQAIDQAGEVIDGYLRNRKPVPYIVPLDPVPGIVAVWTRWIARYLLHKDRVNTAEATDPVVRDYKEACRFLQLTADGKFSLGADDPLAPPSSGSPEVCAPERVFTTGTLRDFGA
jgi:phage gp36-like protein